MGGPKHVCLCKHESMTVLLLAGSNMCCICSAWRIQVGDFVIILEPHDVEL